LVDRIRAQTPADWLGVVAGLALFGYVGWDGPLWDARLQFVLHLMAVGAIVALATVVLRGGSVPRTPIDVPLLGLLAALALATASAANVGMSLRAMASIVAFAAMLPGALVLLRLRPTAVGLVTAVPTALLSAGVLLELLERRIAWIDAGAPGLPPIRVASEATVFGSVAVPPFVIWPAWVLAGLIDHALLRRTLRAVLAVTGVSLTILSGSRSAWLAIVVVGALVVVPRAWRERHRLRLRWPPNRRTVAAGVVGLVALAALAVVLWPRVTATASFVTRFNLWADTLNAWRTAPLFGIGPGFMPFARQAAAEDFSFPVRQPHSHNLPLGVLGDAGIVGLAAAVVLVAAVARYAGPWRARTRLGREAGYLLVGLGVAGLFEDLTFLPNFNLLAILLVAVALTDAGAVSWARAPTGRHRLALTIGAAAIGAVLAAAMVVADAGALAYRDGTSSAAARRWAEAVERFGRAVAIDPWQPTGPKALVIAADAVDDAELAMRAAERATQLNPGDAPSWTNLALLCAEQGDLACQARATERAVAMTERVVGGATDRAVDLLNAALSFEALGRRDDADDAYRRSLLTQRLTAFATDWPRPVEIGRATLPELGPMLAFNRLIAWWAVGEPIDAAAVLYPPTRALAHAMRGERAEAERWIELAMERHAADSLTWEVAVVLYEHWGLPTDQLRRVASVARGGGFPRETASVGRPTLIYDVGAFRAYPRDGYVRSARRLDVVPPYPWVLERTLP